MNKILIVLFLFQQTTEVHFNKAVNSQQIKSIPSIDVCYKFNKLNSRIRDGEINKVDALIEIQTLLPLIKDYYHKGGANLDKAKWVFPLQSYSPKSIGGLNGSGYISSGYDYFTGNKHGGHPAHDIFINDKNQDCIDDFSKNYVNTLSITSGIVVALETKWVVGSNLRGGNYIWIYDPFSNSLFYYAHNRGLKVKLGDIVQPGQTIATIGRSGLNAYKKRSPTHLHIMQLKLDKNFYPKPVDSYKSLIFSTAK